MTAVNLRIPTFPLVPWDVWGAALQEDLLALKDAADPAVGLDTSVTSLVSDPGTATGGALDGRYARTTAPGADAAHVQLGPQVTTKGAATLPVVALQNNDPTSGDNATRVYIVPKASVTTGAGGVLKIFGDDYTTDQVNYRDFGVYFSQDQNGETGTRGDGCFYLNVKSNGTKAGVLPDLVFSAQDGTFVYGRMASPIVGGQAKATFVVGPGKPEHSTKRSLVMEVQGDVGFDGAADRSIYWETTGGSSSNVLSFERTAANGNLRLKLGGSQKALFTGSGDLVLGDNSASMGAASTVGFFHMRSIAGTPTGTPSTYAGAVPLVVDPTNLKLWAYMGGAWKSVTFA